MPCKKGHLIIDACGYLVENWIAFAEIDELNVAFFQGVSGNAAKSGISVGDTIIYTSSFFGDELWPADKLGFARSALSAAPSPVCLVYVNHPPIVIISLS